MVAIEIGDLVTFLGHPEAMAVTALFGEGGIEIDTGLGAVTLTMGPDSLGKYYAAEIGAVEKVRIQ